MENENPYPYHTLEAKKFLGVVERMATSAEDVNVIKKAFFNSYDEKAHNFISGAIAPFISIAKNPNDLLVVIREGQARIYEQFPLMLMARIKRGIEPMTAVFRNDVLDIEGIEFRDARFTLDIRDGDQFLWLFRNRWSFGLYFDFTGELKVTELSSELGQCYRLLEYYSLYTNLENLEQFNSLIARGWFPFIQFLGGHDFQSLASSLNNPDHLQSTERAILNTFDRTRIEAVTSRWWDIETLSKKRKILEAGIEGYLSNTENGTINSIKNLATEIEGILQFQFHSKYGKKASQLELREFIVNLGKSKFLSDRSLGFPGLFNEYLASVVFRGFDLNAADIKLSRNSAGHGVAAPEEYSRARALQLILAIDQISFYLAK